MTTLRQGDRGRAVWELQWLLLVTGHDPGPLDGVFGPRTRRAMTSAQGFLDVREGVLGEANDDEIAALRSLPRRAVEAPRILTPVSAVDMRIALVAGYGHVFGDIAESMASSGRAVQVALSQLAVEHGCEPWPANPHGANTAAAHFVQTWLAPAAGDMTYLWVWTNNIGNMQVRAEDHRMVVDVIHGGVPPRPVGMVPRVSGPPTVPWFSMSPIEGHGASAHRATSPHYAYPNAAEAAANYWRLLHAHYPAAFEAFKRGDPDLAALRLGGFDRGAEGHPATEEPVYPRWYTGKVEAYRAGMRDRFKSFAVSG